MHDTYKYINDLFDGKIPVKRNNPRNGESRYYYFDPNDPQQGSLSNWKTHDIPNETSQYTLENNYEKNLDNSTNYPSNDVQNINDMSEIRNINNTNEYNPFIDKRVDTRQFRDEIGLLESNNNYNISNIDPKNPKDFGAHGYYQFRAPALQDTGYLDKNKNWTGKDNIYSTSDFLNSPSTQEKAMTEYLNKYAKYLKNMNADSFLGKIVENENGDLLELTPQAIMAGAHNQGPGIIKKYIELLEKNKNNNYSLSNCNKYYDDKTCDHIKGADTRMRKMQQIHQNFNNIRRMNDESI